MIRNVTLVEFKPGTTTACIEEIAAAMRALKTPGMLHLSMGPDLSLKDGNMHYAVVADFTDATTFRAFDENPAHERIRREMIDPALSRYERARYEIADRDTSAAAKVDDDHCYKWDIKEALDPLTKQMKKLLEGLEEQRQFRKQKHTTTRNKIEDMRNIFASAKLIWTIVAFLLGGFIGNFVPKIFSGQSAPPIIQRPALPPFQEPMSPGGIFRQPSLPSGGYRNYGPLPRRRD